MTINQIATLLGYNIRVIYTACRWAAKQDCLIGRNIKAKKGSSTKVKTISYSADEVIFMLHNDVFSITKMQEEIIRENSDDEMYVRKEKKIKIPTALNKYLNFFTIKDAPTPKTCSSCAFLTGRKPNKAGCKESPYCNFYEVFLNKAKPSRNIYRDRCDSYEKSEQSPLIFLREGMFSLDTFNKPETKTLGFDNSVFTTGKTKGDKPIILLK